MKKAPIICFCLTLLLTSCFGPDIRFVEPQPEHLSELNSIPEKFQGTFVVQKDTIKVTKYTINKDSIGQENLIVKGWGDYLFVNVLEDGLYKFTFGKAVNYWNNEELSLNYFTAEEFDIKEGYSIEEILIANQKRYPIVDVDTANGYFILDNVSVNNFQQLLNSSESRNITRVK